MIDRGSSVTMLIEIAGIPAEVICRYPVNELFLFCIRRILVFSNMS